MKDAARSDAWRRVETKWTPGTGISALVLPATEQFEPDEIPTPRSLTIFAGPNATGKTRLLLEIHAALKEEHSEIQLEFQNPGSVDRVSYLDIAWQVRRQQLSISNDTALQDRIDQAGTSEFRGPVLADIAWALNSSIEKARVTELESDNPIDDSDMVGSDAPIAEEDSHSGDETDDIPLDHTRHSAASGATIGHAATQASLEFRPDVIPFFEVQYAGGFVADSHTLSQGELSLLTLIWALTASANSEIMLLDEPDAHLSPVSGSRALDLIAKYSIEQGFQCFVTSHGYLALAAVPNPSFIVLAERNQYTQKVKFKGGTADALWRALRVRPPLRNLLVVEDEAGSQLLRLIARLGAIDLDWDSRIAVVGGSASVRDAARFPERLFSTLNVIAVLDGDERKRGKLGHALILPEDMSPEDLALREIQNHPDSILESVAGHDLLSALGRSAGDDPHDRLKEVADTAGVPLTVLREAAWAHWLQYTADGNAFLEDFTTRLSGRIC